MPTRRLHPEARTTRAQRRQIQRNRETDRACALKFGLNVKTVAKWRGRDIVDDAQMGPKTPPWRALPPEYEALVVALRQLTWASLDNLLPCLQRDSPDLSRSTLYRAWAKWGVGSTPRFAEGPDFPLARGRTDALGHAGVFWVQVVQLALDDKRLLFFAIEEASGWIFANLCPSLDVGQADRFLRGLFNEKPVKRLIIHFNQAFCDEVNPAARHQIRLFCEKKGIEQILAKPNPTPIGPLQKGWPGFADHADRRPSPRKSKLTSPTRRLR